MTRSTKQAAALISLAAPDEDIADMVIDVIWQVQNVSHYGIATQLQIADHLGWPIGSLKDKARARRILSQIMPLAVKRASALHPGLILSLDNDVYQLIAKDSTSIGAVMAEVPRIRSAMTKLNRAMNSMPEGLPVGREVRTYLKIILSAEEGFNEAARDAALQFAALPVDVG